MGNLPIVIDLMSCDDLIVHDEAKTNRETHKNGQIIFFKLKRINIFVILFYEHLHVKCKPSWFLSIRRLLM